MTKEGRLEKDTIMSFNRIEKLEKDKKKRKELEISGPLQLYSERKEQKRLFNMQTYKG